MHTSTPWSRKKGRSGADRNRTGKGGEPARFLNAHPEPIGDNSTTGKKGGEVTGERMVPPPGVEPGCRPYEPHASRCIMVERARGPAWSRTRSLRSSVAHATVTPPGRKKREEERERERKRESGAPARTRTWITCARGTRTALILLERSRVPPPGVEPGSRPP